MSAVTKTPSFSLLNLIKNETKVSKIKGGKNCQLSPQPLVFQFTLMQNETKARKNKK